MGEIRADLRVEFRKDLEAATAKVGVELRELIVGGAPSSHDSKQSSVGHILSEDPMLRVNFHILQCGVRTAWLGM
jgi:hypothetical protein